jgi:hypothetical protein
MEKKLKNSQTLNINSKEDADRALFDLKTRAGAVESRRITDKNKLEKLRTEIITRLFATMKEMGVDPSNLDSISSFMQKLEQEDPDIFLLFEGAMSGILGEQSPQGSSQNQPPVSAMPEANASAVPDEGGGGSGLANRFSNLQNSLMRK